MERFKTIISVFFVSFSIFLFTGCEGEEEEDDPITEESGIYFRIVQYLDYPGWSDGLWCNLISGNYTDTNPGVPDNAAFNVYYGPLQAGEYSATFWFDVTNPGSAHPNFTYKLENPPPGYKRMYTKVLRKFNESLNRCLNTAPEAWTLTYEDIPLE